MFIGHLALGLAAKRATPRVSLAVLFSAAQFADMLWPVLVALGIEQVRIHPGDTAFTPLEFVSYPYSHSLLLAIWGLVFGLVYERAAHARRQAKAGGPFFSRTVVIITALVVSHWVLDVVTHRPDMPLYPGSVRIGLGLWNSVPGTIAIEVAMYGAGLWVYFSRPHDSHAERDEHLLDRNRSGRSAAAHHGPRRHARVVESRHGDRRLALQNDSARQPRRRSERRAARALLD